MPSKDGRRNACVENQMWTQMVYIDNMSMNRFIKKVTTGKNSVYGFSGMSEVGNLRIDFNKKSNANLIGDFFELIDDIPNKSVDVFIVDPLFELYNPNPHVWSSLIKRGKMPESTRNTRFFGKNHKWQGEVWKKVVPGGIMVSKRNMPNTNVLSKLPQMFYVHDSRPMAHIVRIDHK